MSSLEVHIPRTRRDITRSVAKAKARDIARDRGFTGLERSYVHLVRVANGGSGPSLEYVVVFPEAVPAEN
jgi:hypothetical protein